MKPNPTTKQAYEEVVGKHLSDEDLAEMASILTRYIEMLAEIAMKQKEQSKNQHKEKE